MDAAIADQIRYEKFHIIGVRNLSSNKKNIYIIMKNNSLIWHKIYLELKIGKIYGVRMIFKN